MPRNALFLIHFEPILVQRDLPKISVGKIGSRDHIPLIGLLDCVFQESFLLCLRSFSPFLVKHRRHYHITAKSPYIYISMYI